MSSNHTSSKPFRLLPLKIMKVSSFYQLYQKKQLTRHQTQIFRTESESYIYYATFTGKLKTFTCDQCQLIAAMGRRGGNWVGYAFKSNGFPHFPEVHPIFEEKVSIGEIEEVGIDDDYLCLQVRGREKPWRFKLESGNLVVKWVDLLFRLAQKQQQNTKINQSQNQNESNTDSIDFQANINHQTPAQNNEQPSFQKASTFPSSSPMNQQATPSGQLSAQNIILKKELEKIKKKYEEKKKAYQVLEKVLRDKLSKIDELSMQIEGFRKLIKSHTGKECRYDEDKLVDSMEIIFKEETANFIKIESNPKLIGKRKFSLQSITSSQNKEDKNQISEAPVEQKRSSRIIAVEHRILDMERENRLLKKYVETLKQDIRCIQLQNRMLTSRKFSQKREPF